MAKSLNLYLVQRTDAYEADYDQTSGAVIAAATEGDAREFATTLRGDQDRSVWYRFATVELIGVARPDMAGGVVFSEFRAS